MKASPHLLVYISAHGFGHIAQVAPVLNALTARVPGVRLTLKSAAPMMQLTSRLTGEFLHIPEATDFGMVMASAMDVKVEPSMQAYSAFHRDWNARVQHEAQNISRLVPDFVLSDVAYLPLAAAKQVDIPCAAMCSLNWGDIFRHYCGAMSEAAQIHCEMQQAYASADAFLRLTPGMPMVDLPNLKPIGPVAGLGRNRRSEIDMKLGLHCDDHLVLVTLGGIATRLPMQRWPVLPGIHWLVSADWEIEHTKVSILEMLGMNFTDVLASCDALLCKPGYGSFVEAACNGVPVLYVGRPDWPEQPCLVEWLSSHGCCLEVEREELEAGAIGGTLEALFSLPKAAPVAPGGIAEVVDYLASYLC